MNWLSKVYTNQARALGIILGILVIVSSVTSAAADAAGWKNPPDPEIVNFERADAEIVTQALVTPPFLPEHEQVAYGPPRLVKIRMDIVEREVEIASARCAIRSSYGARQRSGRHAGTLGPTYNPRNASRELRFPAG